MNDMFHSTLQVIGIREPPRYEFWARKRRHLGYKEVKLQLIAHRHDRIAYPLKND